MPSADAGFYHLTSLIPIHQGDEDPQTWRWQPRMSSAVHSLRELLDSFRSVDVPGTNAEESGLPVARAVPFSRNERTHFARLVIVDDLAYNGLKQPDTLISLARDRLGFKVPLRERADHLEQPYLLVLIEFDCPDGSPASVADYLEELWQSMEQEWTLILRHCPGFQWQAPRLRLRSYLELILNNEIESTFSFSAYPWAAERARRWQPKTGRFLPSPSQNRIWNLMPLAMWAIVTILVLVVTASQLVRLLLDHAALPGLLMGLLLLAALGLLAPLLWQRLLRKANRPWPSQPGSDLRSILKALQLQSGFLELAEGWQNRPDDSHESLRRRFRNFLHDSQPGNLSGPQLMPGQIRPSQLRRQP